MKTHWKRVLSATLELVLLLAAAWLLIYPNPAGAYQENQQPALGGGERGSGLSNSEQLRLIRMNAEQGNPVAQFNLGITLIRMNRVNEGIEEMQACIRSKGDGNLAEKARKTIDDPRRAVYDFVPDFSVVASGGEYITSDDLRGRVVLLDFWGAWCGPCRNAVPDLRRLANKYSGENFILVSIDVNDPEEKWREFLEENKMNWTQVRDDKSSLGDVKKRTNHPAT